MKQVSIVLIALSLLVSPLIAADAGNPSSAAKTPAAATPVPAKQTLLFFLNPNGAPCQMQDRILKEMGPSLTEKASVKYISVSDPSARELFGQYGIRALPSLIVLDAKGKEAKRFPPGIQSAETVKAVFGIR